MRNDVGANIMFSCFYLSLWCKLTSKQNIYIYVYVSMSCCLHDAEQDKVSRLFYFHFWKIPESYDGC